MNPDRFAGAVLLALVFASALVAVVRGGQRHRAVQAVAAARLGLVFMPRRTRPRRRTYKDREFPVRPRLKITDVPPVGFWDGSSPQRTIVDCPDCSHPASAEFGDHGGACIDRGETQYVTPASALGIVRDTARRLARFDRAEVYGQLRTQRPNSQSYDSVVSFAIAAGIYRGWIEPLPASLGCYHSLVWTGPDAQGQLS